MLSVREFESMQGGWRDRNPEPDVGRGAEIFFFLTYVLPDAAEPK